jgi:hypothetical protein
MINSKKGDKVILKGFTGIKLGVFEVTACTKKTVTLVKRNGDEMIFDRKTGKQTNVEEGKEKYANSIIEDDGSYVAPSTKGASKKKSAKAAPKKTAAPAADSDEEDDESDEDEAEEAPAPKKTGKKAAPKASSKKPVKKSAPVVDEDDDEEDEDEDDDDFEEIDD